MVLLNHKLYLWVKNFLFYLRFCSHPCIFIVGSEDTASSHTCTHQFLEGLSVSAGTLSKQQQIRGADSVVIITLLPVSLPMTSVVQGTGNCNFTIFRCLRYYDQQVCIPPSVKIYLITITIYLFVIEDWEMRSILFNRSTDHSPVCPVCPSMLLIYKSGMINDDFQPQSDVTQLCLIA